MCKSQYEYAIEKCRYNIDDISGRVKWLNDIASEGWELVCVDTSTQRVFGGDTYGEPSYIFRRFVKYVTPDYNSNDYSK